MSAFSVESTIAGEFVRAGKSMGDRVCSGTIIDNGYIEVTADREGDDTTFTKMIEKELKNQDYRVAMAGDALTTRLCWLPLMSDSLEQFAHGHSLAKATVRNMLLAVGTVALLLAGMLLGKMFLASGMLVHELSVLLVTLNAVRLIRYRARAGKSDEEPHEPAPRSMGCQTV